MILKIKVPIRARFADIVAGNRVEISGIIYTARDAVMAKLTKLIKNGDIKNLPIQLRGAAVMHTAFSPSGFGPTSSNKEEIEGAMGILSEAGVRFHLGKGAIKQQTVNDISKFGAVFVVVPPVSALLQCKLISQRVVAFKEEGMEALYELKVNGLPGIIAAAKGVSIFHT